MENTYFFYKKNIVKVICQFCFFGCLGTALWIWSEKVWHIFWDKSLLWTQLRAQPPFQNPHHKNSFRVDWLNSRITVFVKKALYNFQQNEQAILKNDFPPKITEIRRRVRQETLEEARLQLVSLVYSLPINSDFTIKKKSDQNEHFRRRMGNLVFRFVTDYEIIGSEFIRISLSLPLTGKAGLYSLLAGFVDSHSELPEFVNTKFSFPITSLIIVSKEIPGFQPSLVPRVYSQSGSLIYSSRIANHSCFIEKGLVSYHHSVAMARRSRQSGSKPYIVYAATWKGERPSDLVLHSRDADRILTSPSGRSALRNCRVIFVIRPTAHVNLK